MSGKLTALRSVAALDAQIFELLARQEEIPGLLGKDQAELERAQALLAAKEAEIKELRVKNEIKEKDLQIAEQVTIKLRQQISQAKSNKEYQTLQHEILSKEADNARIEDAVLVAMQKVDRQMDERKALVAAVKVADQRLSDEKTALGKESARLAVEIAQLREKRAGECKAVPADIFAKYERLISRRGQTAMVAAVNGTCQGCFMTLRPETMAQLKKADDLVFCHSCQRILYLDEE